MAVEAAGAVVGEVQRPSALVATRIWSFSSRSMCRDQTSTAPPPGRTARSGSLSESPPWAVIRWRAWSVP